MQKYFILYCIFLANLLIAQSDYKKINIYSLINLNSIIIDGKIDQSEWKDATKISDLTQREPLEGDSATEKTDIYLCYDSENFYVAFRCWDSSPSNIIANIMRRDEWLLNNDCIELYLDTYHDLRNAFYFSTNPLGAQRDGIITAELGDDQQNWDWNGVWENASTIDSTGWTAEISIPFKTLRFDDNDSLIWGINFARYIPRKREEDFWAPILREYGWAGKYRAASYGIVFGLKDIQHPVKLEFKPFLLTGFKKDFEEDDKYSFEKNIGFDAKYHITSNLNMDISFNTDFAQVEADQEQINLTRFELFLPEKREFFLEGASIFRFGERYLFPLFTPSSLFFSRRIGISEDNELIPVIGGIKMTGKIGKINTGLINIVTEDINYFDDDSFKVSIPVTNYSVLRLQGDLFDQSSIGIIGLNKESLDNTKYNRNFGIDANFFLSNKIQVGGYIANSLNSTNNNKNLSGFIDFLYNDDLFNFYVSQSSIQENFEAEIGFFPRTGIRKTMFNVAYSPRPDILSIRQLTVFDDYSYIANQNNELETRTNFLGLFTVFNNGSYIFAMLSDNYEKLDEDFEIHDDIILPIDTYRFTNFYAEYETDKSKTIAGLIKINLGEFYNGDILGYGFGTDLRIGSHLSIELDFDQNNVRLNQNKDKFNSSILSSRITYSFSPKFYVKPFIQWNSDEKTLNTNLLLNYIHRPGSDIYFVYNEELKSTKNNFKSNNRALLLKITYLLGL